MNTILFIENNPLIRDNLTEGFEMEGYNVLSANNGNIGLALAREFMPDLIVCGVIIDGMSGYEVLRLLLISPITCEIPFIFCTTKAEKSDRAFALKLGANDYITKPFEFELLFTMARSWIKSGSRRCHVNKLSFAGHINDQLVCKCGLLFFST